MLLLCCWERTGAACNILRHDNSRYCKTILLSSTRSVKQWHTTNETKNKERKKERKKRCSPCLMPLTKLSLVEWGLWLSESPKNTVITITRPVMILLFFFSWKNNHCYRQDWKRTWMKGYIPWMKKWGRSIIPVMKLLWRKQYTKDRKESFLRVSFGSTDETLKRVSLWSSNDTTRLLLLKASLFRDNIQAYRECREGIYCRVYRRIYCGGQSARVSLWSFSHVSLKKMKMQDRQDTHFSTRIKVTWSQDTKRTSSSLEVPLTHLSSFKTHPEDLVLSIFSSRRFSKS